MPTVSPARHPPHSHRHSPSNVQKPGTPQKEYAGYSKAFWLTLASSFMVGISNGLLYRYADFVTFLGGTEFHLGWITGIGMSGSLVVRLVLGTWIDRYGTRVIWLGSALLMAVACAAHLLVTLPTSPAIYLLRILYCCGLAGFNGASMTFISKLMPTQRMAETVGLLGAAGFSGIICGTLLSDLLINTLTAGQEQIVQLFWLIVGANLAAMPFGWLATRNEAKPQYVPGPSLFGVVRQYRQDAVLTLAAAMGLAIGLPQIFLRSFAVELNIPRISVFFVIYSITAVGVRLFTRRWVERFGNRPIILLSSSMMVVSVLLFLPVHAEWQLVLPACCFGAFHALLFPALMVAGSATFPMQYRGLATVMMLAMFDLGLFVGSPLIGLLLYGSELARLPPYTTMFILVACLLAAVSLWYAIVSRRKST